MKIGPLFWLLMILAVLAWVGAFWFPHVGIGVPVLTFILLGLLGWQVFGPALQR